MGEAMTVDEVALERRLTRMEGELTSGFAGLYSRLDTLNGQVARNTSHRHTHDQLAAAREAMAASRRRDLGLLFAMMTLAASFGGLIAKVVLG